MREIVVDKLSCPAKRWIRWSREGDTICLGSIVKENKIGKYSNFKFWNI